MSVYKTSKKVRYVASVVFVLFMAFIVGGTLISQQQANVGLTIESITPR